MSCTRTATACSARCTTPRTPSRRRCCAPGAGSRAFRSAARCARGCTDRDQHEPQAGRAPARAPGRLSPAAEYGAELGAPLAETVSIEPYPSGPQESYEQRETLELALIAAVQRLPPRRSARCCCCARPSASARPRSRRRSRPRCRRSTAPCSARATRWRNACRARASRRRCARSATRPSAPSSSGYMDAWQRGDIDAVVAMLAEDAILAMPPTATWFRGREAIGDFYRRYPGQTHLAPRRDERQRPVGARLLRVRRRCLPADGDRRADARREWPDPRGHRVPGPAALGGLRAIRVRRTAPARSPGTCRMPPA